MVLEIGLSDVSDDEARQIRTDIEDSDGRTLMLTSKHITDAGAKAVADALSHSDLMELTMWGTRITDVGGLHFLRAIPRSNLTFIEFCNASVSPAVRFAVWRAVAVRHHRNKLFLLLRLRFFEFTDGDHAMVHRVAEFLWW